MKRIVIAVLLFLLCFSLSCASTISSRPIKKGNEVLGYWYTYDGSKRGTYLLFQNSKFSFCSEPTPDMAFNRSMDLAAQMALNVEDKVTVDPEVKLKMAQEAIKLAEKGQGVLFLRDSLYQICVYANFLEVTGRSTPATDKNIFDLYSKAMDVSAKIAEAEIQGKKAEIQKANASFIEEYRQILEKNPAAASGLLDRLNLKLEDFNPKPETDSQSE
ncbi:MAG: hypothetical protein GX444_10775 [Myxococcales bacterium]|nr:hypothetical protein [Myxococcales bacterium]